MPPSPPAWYVRTAADAARWLRGETYLGDVPRDGWRPAADDVVRAVRSAEIAVQDAEASGWHAEDRRAALEVLRAAMGGKEA